MKFSLLVAFGIFILVGVGAMTAYYLYQGKNFQTTSLNLRPNPSPIPSPISKLIQGTSSAIPNIQPASGSNTSALEAASIKIIEPYNNSKISSPLKIKGTANSISIVSLKIKDQNGNVLSEGKASPCIDSNPCLFEASLIFNSPQAGQGTLEISTDSTNKSISVTF